MYLTVKLIHIRIKNDTLKSADRLGNNPMVGATVAVAVAVEEAMK